MLTAVAMIWAAAAMFTGIAREDNPSGWYGRIQAMLIGGMAGYIISAPFN